MRNIILAIALCLFLVPMSSPAQDTVTMVMVPKSSLTSQQKASMQVAETRAWVGVGREIGDAVNTSLSAVTEQSNKFASTPVGRMTAMVVIWKVIGKNILGIGFAALLWLTVGTSIFLSMAKYTRKKYVRRETVDQATGKVTAREYDWRDGDGEAIAFHFLLLGILIGISAIAIFAS